MQNARHFQCPVCLSKFKKKGFIKHQRTKLHWWKSIGNTWKCPKYEIYNLNRWDKKIRVSNEMVESLKFPIAQILSKLWIFKFNNVVIAIAKRMNKQSFCYDPNISKTEQD